MNSLLRIRIQVAVEKSAEIAKLSKALGTLGGGARSTAPGMSAMAAAAKGATSELAKMQNTLTSLKSGLRFGTMAEAAAQVKKLGDGMVELNRTARNAALPQWAQTTAQSINKVQKEINAVGVASKLNFGQRLHSDIIKVNKALAGIGKSENLKDGQKRQAALVAEAAAQAALYSRTERERIASAKRSVNAAVSAQQQQAALEARQAKYMLTLNTNLSNQIAADKAAKARTDAALRLQIERNLLKEIARLQKQYAVGQISGSQMRGQLSNISNSRPMGSDVNLAAAGAIKRYDDAQKAAADSTDLLNRSAFRLHRTLGDAGKNIQWTGRQLEYNFTLPIIRATEAVFELQMENQKALTSMVKVYGDVSVEGQRLSTDFLLMGQNLQPVTKEMTESEYASYHLGRAFRALSDGMGISMDQVSEMGALWAATGLTGANLAQAVRNNAEAMIIGDFNSSEDAFKSLIQIQKGYVLEASEVREAMALINVAENITAASFTDLTEATGRASASARNYGVDLRELVGLITLLVPANTAETAGNGLKTLLSRVMAPTEEAIETMKELGLEIDASSWQSLNAIERLQALAGAYEGLTGAQRAHVGEVVAGRYQLNRYDLLMQGLNDRESDFYKVLNATADGLGENSTAMKTYNAEILLFLSSTPQRIEIAKTRIMNLASQILIRLLPAILSALDVINKLANAFSNLDPDTQRWILIGIVVLAALGPVMRLSGAFLQLGDLIFHVGKAVFWFGGQLGTVTKFIFVKMLPALFSLAQGFITTAIAALGPWGLLILALAAVGAAIYIFRDDIKQALEPALAWAEERMQSFYSFFVRVFNALPKPVAAAFRVLFDVITKSVEAIWKVLQWLNPFQRHSPSLVDNVTAGVAEIARQYASLSGIGAVYSRAATQLREFAAATAEIKRSGRDTKRAQTRVEVAEYAPGAVSSMDALWAQMDAVEAAMEAVSAQISVQQAIVDGLDAEYKRLTATLDKATHELDKLKDVADAAKDALNDAQQELDDWASTPIAGMRAMSDAIFDNEMAQKALRLEILKMEEAYGSLDDIESKMANLAGEVEQLQGIQADLRSQGAGSEITGLIEEQIKALRDQAKALEDSAQPFDDLQKKLKELERQGEILNLEQSLNFDPLTRQIEQMGETINELPFDVIVAGVAAAKAKVDELTVAYESAESAVKDQEAVVKILQTARDDLGMTLDAEKAKLEALELAYSDLKDLYGEMDQSLNDIISSVNDIKTAAEEAADALSDLAIAGMGDFELGDIGTVPNTEDMNLEELANSWLDEFNKDLENFDPFGSIKESFNKFVLWWDEKIMPWWDVTWAAMQAAFSVPMDNIKRGWESLQSAYNTTKEALGTATDWLVEKFGWLKEQGLEKFTTFKDKLVEAGKDIEKFFFEDIPYWVGYALGTLAELPIKGPQKIADLGVKLWEGIEVGMQYLKTRVSNDVDTLVSFFENLPGRIASLASTILTAAIGVGRSIGDGITEGVRGVWGIGATLLDSIELGLKMIWNDIIYRFETSINSAIRGFNAASSLIPDLPTIGLGWAQVSLHTGGIVPGVTGQEVPAILQAGEGVASIKTMNLLRRIERNAGPSNESNIESNSSTKTFIFNGDLSFPNITNPDDAKKFLHNLEVLARS